MDFIFWIILVAISITTLLIGYYVGKTAKTSYDGTLVVDFDDPEKDVFLFKLDIPIAEVETRKDLKIKVDAHRN